MKHLVLSPCVAALASMTLVSVAHGQSGSRDAGGELGTDLVYQASHDISFNGGSDASLDDDLGLAITFGYRFNDRFELQFSLDWQTVDYEATVVSDIPSLSFSARGDLESITPRVSFNFNLMEGDFTPYVTGGIGYSFIDTNIPDAPPQTACWWDPWWGHVCNTFQSTRSVEEFTYQAGVGLRWDFSSGYTARLAYEKHWLDLGEATSTPGFDQIKFGIAARY
jgi:opacity protein-like surface antigen